MALGLVALSVAGVLLQFAFQSLSAAPFILELLLPHHHARLKRARLCLELAHLGPCGTATHFRGLAKMLLEFV